MWARLENFPTKFLILVHPRRTNLSGFQKGKANKQKTNKQTKQKQNKQTDRQTKNNKTKQSG